MAATMVAAPTHATRRSRRAVAAEMKKPGFFWPSDLQVSISE